MTDLTERLQRYVRVRREMPLTQLGDSIHCIHTGTEHEAELRLSDLTAGVSLLETLTQENARLREALEPLARVADVKDRCAKGAGHEIEDSGEVLIALGRWSPPVTMGDARAARKALGGGDER